MIIVDDPILAQVIADASKQIVVDGMWISLTLLLGFEAIRKIYIRLMGESTEAE